MRVRVRTAREQGVGSQVLGRDRRTMTVTVTEREQDRDPTWRAQKWTQ